ncbi:hypothetical protein [Zhaonella formicivorans]|uniref:hypothetical protein n=1 Tax=Zhaonella formicivorans TaxID=2528593 RepID=UPI0010E60F17|nr:hypothetical protein [Zhaonella formicivorans]
MQIPLLRITSAGWQLTADLLALRQGQVYRGVVQRVEGADIVLNLNGAKISAQAAVELQPGQVLWLEAVQVSPEGVTLKVLTSPALEGKDLSNFTAREAVVAAGTKLSPGNFKLLEALLAGNLPVNAKIAAELRQQIRGLSPEQAEGYLQTRIGSDKNPASLDAKLNIKAAADSLGFAPTPENLKIVKALMAHNLPVTAKTVEELRQELRGVSPDKAEAYLQVRAWSKATNLPEDQQGRQIVADFLLGQTEPEEMARALKLINQAESTQLGQPGLSCLWWQNGEQHGEIYLWAEGDKKNKFLLPNGIVALHFYTRNLGQLWVRLGRGRDGLYLAVDAENELGLKLFQTNWPDLDGTLRQLGYEINKVSYRLGEVNSFIQLTLQETDILKYSSIDYRA